MLVRPTAATTGEQNTTRRSNGDVHRTLTPMRPFTHQADKLSSVHATRLQRVSADFNELFQPVARRRTHADAFTSC